MTSSNLPVSSAVQRLLHILQYFVSFLRILESMPLCYGSTGRGQHVGPMAQLSSGAHAAKYTASNGFRGTNTIVVHNGNNKTDFLKISPKKYNQFISCWLGYASKLNGLLFILFFLGLLRVKHRTLEQKNFWYFRDTCSVVGFEGDKLFLVTGRYY